MSDYVSQQHPSRGHSRLTARIALGACVLLAAGTSLQACGGSSVSESIPKSTPNIVPPADTSAEKPPCRQPRPRRPPRAKPPRRANPHPRAAKNPPARNRAAAHPAKEPANRAPLAGPRPKPKNRPPKNLKAPAAPPAARARRRPSPSGRLETAQDRLSPPGGARSRRVSAEHLQRRGQLWPALNSPRSGSSSRARPTGLARRPALAC